MRTLYIYCMLIICVGLSSCDFNINDSPGRQYSLSVKESKQHRTFICEYKVKGNKINGHPINTIFAERKFWRNTGVLLTKEINCCESQLIVVSEDIIQQGGEGFSYDWNISGFSSIGSYWAYADFRGVAFPDVLPITVINKTNNKNLSTRLYLVKVTGIDR
jgi:hypothetical protein